jgi:hypothetical protein
MHISDFPFKILDLISKWTDFAKEKHGKIVPMDLPQWRLWRTARVLWPHSTDPQMDCFHHIWAPGCKIA